MWKGCVLFLVLFGAAYAVELQLLPPAGEPYRWIFALLLGFLVTLLLSSAWGLLHSFGRWRLARRDISTWRDHELVAVSGQLQPLRGALKAPFTLRDAVLYEYQVARPVQSSGKNQPSERIELSGMAMARCGVYTNSGVIQVTGVPAMTHVKQEQFVGVNFRQQAARYIAATRWRKHSGSLVQGFQEMVTSLSSPDAETKQDHAHRDTHLPVLLSDDHSNASTEVSSTGGRGPGDPGVGAPAPGSLAERIDRLLQQANAKFRERVVEAGATVTLFGMYRANTRTIDMTNDMFDSNRALYLGSLQQVVGKLIVKAFLGLVFVSGITVAAHYGAFYESGHYLDKIADFIGQ